MQQPYHDGKRNSSRISSQDRKCTYDVTLWHFRVNTVAVETKPECVADLQVTVNYNKYWTLHNNDFMSNLFRRQQKTYVGLHVGL
jgi:hypothetical protein